MKNIIKLCGIEFYEDELKKLYFEDNKKFIIKYSEIHQIGYSENLGFKTTLIAKKGKNIKIGFARRGRFYIGNASLVNNILGREFVVD